MPEDEKPKLRPTVIQPPARRSPKAASETKPATTQTPLPKATKPTAIPGKESSRLPVTRADLEKLSPSSAANVYVKALQLLSAFKADKMTERSSILWGHELQKSFSGLIDQTLTLSQNPVLSKVQRYLNRMMNILGAIDVLAVCGHDSAGMFGSITKSMNVKIDTPFELREAQTELKLLVQYMGESLDQLLDLKIELERSSSLLEQIAVEIESAALAALFLSDYFKGSPIAQRFMERSMSLTQTLAQIRQNDSIRKNQIDQPLKLVNAIQNVALVMMPGLISSLVSITTLMQSRAVSPTEAGEINYQLRNTIVQLNP